MEDLQSKLNETLKSGEVCRILKIGRSTLSQWVKEGKLHPIMVGCRRRFLIGEIHKLVKI